MNAKTGRLADFEELIVGLDRLEAGSAHTLTDLDRIRQLAQGLGLTSAGYGWTFDRAALRTEATAARALAHAQSRVSSFDNGANQERIGKLNPIGKCAEAQRLAAEGLNPKEIALAIGRSVSSVYVYLAKDDCSGS